MILYLIDADLLVQRAFTLSAFGIIRLTTVRIRLGQHLAELILEQVSLVDLAFVERSLHEILL